MPLDFITAGGLHLFPRPAAPAPPAGVKGADVMTSMAHCMHMSKTFNLPYNEEPSFGVLNHERGVHLAKAGMSDRPQLWVLTTGFEDGKLDSNEETTLEVRETGSTDTLQRAMDDDTAPSGEFAFDADATTYDHVESFAGDASKYGSVDVVCGGVSPSMSHVESSKRRVHQFDVSRTKKSRPGTNFLRHIPEITRKTINWNLSRARLWTSLPSSTLAMPKSSRLSTRWVVAGCRIQEGS